MSLFITWKWREPLPKHQKSSHHQGKVEWSFTWKTHGSANMPITGYVHTELKRNISTKTIDSEVYIWNSEYPDRLGALAPPSLGVLSWSESKAC